MKEDDAVMIKVMLFCVLVLLGTIFMGVIDIYTVVSK